MRREIDRETEQIDDKGEKVLEAAIKQSNRGLMQIYRTDEQEDKVVDVIRHDLDNSYKSVYKAGLSIKTTLLSIKNEIHLSLARGEPTTLVLLLTQLTILLC